MPTLAEPVTRILSTVNELERYLRRAAPTLAFDTELKGLRRHHHLLGLSFYDNESAPVFVHTEHFFDGIPVAEIAKVCNRYFHRFQGIAHNAKFDLGVFKRHGIMDIPMLADTMMLCHIHNPDNIKNLETRTKLDLKIDKKTYKEIIGKTWDKIDWVADLYGGFDKKGKEIAPCITLDNMAQYAGFDVWATYRLYEYYWPLLEKENLLTIHSKIELPLAYVLRDMQEAGVRINLARLTRMSEELHGHITRLNDEVYDLAGCVFNIGSPKQKAEVLFDRLGLPCLHQTPSGGRSTDKHALDELAGKHPVVDKILEYTEARTLLGSFVDKIPVLVDSDGRLRCSFNSDGARTGRMSASEPNLQNQPNNPKFPVREAFIPREGYVFCVADYSQIEPRVLAHYSNDKQLQAIYERLGDIYQGVADAQKITRKAAKVVVLAIMYGLGPASLSTKLGITEKQGKAIIADFYRQYPDVDRWKKEVENTATRTGQVRNLFGRIRRLPEARNSENRGRYFGALRQAVNTQIQGSAADIMKIAMIKLHKRLQGLPAQLLLVVHDEVVVEVRKDFAVECMAIIEAEMAHAVTLNVSINADGKVCRNWADMKNDAFEGIPLDELESRFIRTVVKSEDISAFIHLLL